MLKKHTTHSPAHSPRALHNSIHPRYSPTQYIEHITSEAKFTALGCVSAVFSVRVCIKICLKSQDFQWKVMKTESVSVAIWATWPTVQWSSCCWPFHAQFVDVRLCKVEVCHVKLCCIQKIHERRIIKNNNKKSGESIVIWMPQGWQIHSALCPRKSRKILVVLSQEKCAKVEMCCDEMKILFLG